MNEKELIYQMYGQWRCANPDAQVGDAFVAGAEAVLEYLKEHNRI